MCADADLDTRRTLGRRDVHACDVIDLRERTNFEITLAPLRHHLVVIRLTLREIGVRRHGAVLVVVPITGYFAGAFDHREGGPVAFLRLAENLGHPVGRSQDLNELGSDVVGEPRGDTGIGCSDERLLRVHCKQARGVVEYVGNDDAERAFELVEIGNSA